MTTFSTSLKLELPGDGQQAGTWGQTTNRNLGSLLEQAITGVGSIIMANADYTLSSLNGVPDEARNAVIVVTGTNSADKNVIVPAVEKIYTITNNTSGGYSIVVKTVAGTGFTVPNGQTAYIYCDGTNCQQAINYIESATLGGTPVAPTATYGTNTTQLATTAFVQATIQALYPVGSVYINAAVNTSPATLFGFGTWVAIGTGKVLVGQDTGDTSFDVLGETGGSKDAIVVSHSHTYSGDTASAGYHNHGVADPGHSHGTGGAGGGGPFPYSNIGSDTPSWTTTAHTTGIGIEYGGSHTHSYSGTTSTEGSSGTNANLQPYVVVKMWQRTA